MQEWDIGIHTKSREFFASENTSLIQNNMTFLINMEYFIKLEEKSHLYIRKKII